MDRIIESLYINRELYTAIFMPVCSKYRLTMAEMLVLLFLSKHGNTGTASDIVDKLKITKSHVSVSVHDLEERGYIQGSHEGCNRRTIRLRLCGSAEEVVREGKQAQERFLSVLTRGFSEQELSAFVDCIRRINENADEYLHQKGVNHPNARTESE